MKRILTIGLFAVAFLFTSSGFAAEMNHRFLASSHNLGIVSIVGADGKVEWQCKIGPMLQDAWLLADGNILASYKSGVKVVNKQKEVVWEYHAPKNAEIHTVQPLADGAVLVCECGTKRLIEIDQSGAITKEIKLKTGQKKHLQFRGARKTARGTYWVAFMGDSKVKEVDGKGKILREITTGPGSKQASTVIERPNGNILVTTGYGGGVKEFDKEGDLVWEMTRDALGVIDNWYVAGAHILPNGNIILSVYRGNPQYIEVSPDQKIVATYHNKALDQVSTIYCLDDKGSAEKGEVLK